MPELNVDELNPRIGLELGVTINIGNFQSIRPSIRLEINVPPDRTAKETLVDMNTWILEAMDAAVDASLEYVANITEELT